LWDLFVRLNIIIIISACNHIISIIIMIVIIIDVFGTCCEGSWPMMPASGAIQWWWPVLLAMFVNGVGHYLHLLCPNDVF